MLRPLRGKVLVLPNDKVKETEGGIIVPEAVSYNPELGLRRGKVVSIGEGVRDVKVGDEACYMAYSGIAVTHEDVRYLTMAEEEVLGITV